LLSSVLYCVPLGAKTDCMVGIEAHRRSGEIGRRKLTPGRYRALLVATDAAGNGSRQRQLAFTIVRG